MSLPRLGIALLSVCLLLTSCGRQKRERARQSLHLLETQNRSDSVFRTDTLQLSLAKYFDRHGTRGEREVLHLRRVKLSSSIFAFSRKYH